MRNICTSGRAVTLMVFALCGVVSGQTRQPLERFLEAVTELTPNGPIPEVVYTKDEIKRVQAASVPPRLKATFVLEAVIQRFEKGDVTTEQRAETLRDLQWAARFVKSSEVGPDFAAQWTRTLLAFVTGPEVAGDGGVSYLAELGRFLTESETDLVRGSLLEQTALAMIRTRKDALTGVSTDVGSLAASQALRRSVNDAIQAYRRIPSASPHWHEAQLRQGVLMVEDGRPDEALPFLTQAQLSGDVWVRSVATLSLARALALRSQYAEAVSLLSGDDSVLQVEPFARVLLTALRSAQAGERPLSEAPVFATAVVGGPLIGVPSTVRPGPWAEYRFGAYRRLGALRRGLLGEITQ